MIGRRLLHYRVKSRLGAGGMGEVYRAEDTKLRRDVALKVLPSDVASDPDRLERFEREARTVAALAHPSIVTIYSVEQADGVHFLTMELVEGTTLKAKLRKAGMPLRELFSIAVPIADALAAAHERGITHRDLKPENVMITDKGSTASGRVKVLDFGLAKPAAAGFGPGGSEAPTEALTESGVVMGTVPYMSPEQLQGRPVDSRSDLFSFGVLLYEMSTGRRPFEGESSAALISSILRDTPAVVSDLREDLPRHLGRIVRHCLEKDLERRYQTALDLRNDLEELRREVETGALSEQVAAPSAGGRRWRRTGVAVAAAVAVVLALAGGWWLGRGGEEEAGSDSPGGAAAESSKPSVAVLYFENLTGDESLDWLRDGLTDMLVTDLSQSPEIRVLSTDRLYQILKELNQLDERVASFEAVREVARRGGVNTVILGSFVKAGETIRISIKIQEAGTGEILRTRKIDARGEEELLSRIDDLSLDIRQSFELPESQEADLADRGLSEVTTSSVQAYRYFVEAEKYLFQYKDEEAIALFERAVAADPGYAMALAKLAVTYADLGDPEKAREYSRRAWEHLDRLSEPERAYVEGWHYGQDLATYDRAIEIYERALRRYPHLSEVRSNLASKLIEMERFEEAIPHLEECRRRGYVYPEAYHDLAAAYAAVGDLERAYQVVDEYLKRFPETFSMYLVRANFLLFEGRLEEAEEQIARAESLRPTYPAIPILHWTLHVLREEWDEAEATVAERRDFGIPEMRSIPAWELTILLDYHGRSAEALKTAEQAATESELSGERDAELRFGFALGLMETPGRLEEALAQCRKAQEAGADASRVFVMRVVETVILERLGRSEEADRSVEQLGQEARKTSHVGLQRHNHELRGRIAALRGEWREAVVELEQAESMLSARSYEAARIWFVLASAYLGAGDGKAAEESFRRIVESGVQRLVWPSEYVRSFYFLGQIYEERGEKERARTEYRRFLDYWGDGDVDRDRVERARRFLESS